MKHLEDQELGALLDGESRDGIDHVASCDRCREGLQTLARLEGVLTAAVSRRRWWRAPMAAAAAALLFAAVWSLGPRETPSLDSVVRLLESGTPAQKREAARMLARFPREAVLASPLARGHAEVDVLGPSAHPDPADDWGRALTAVAGDPGYRDFVRAELPRADLMQLLTSKDPELQERAVVIMTKTRHPRFDVVDLIPLLDVPALQRQLLEVLPKVTGRRYDGDPVRWKAYLRGLGDRT